MAERNDTAIGMFPGEMEVECVNQSPKRECGFGTDTRIATEIENHLDLGLGEAIK